MRSEEYVDERTKINRVLIVKLLGYLNGGRFERGVKELPLIDNEVFLVIEDELAKIHNFVDDSDKPITFGTLTLEKNQNISFGINKLFASHIGIFGNTGSGKSYTLSKVYNTLFEIFQDNDAFHNNSKFFILDFNGEYVNSEDWQNDNVVVEKEFKQSFHLSTKDATGSKFPLPIEALEDINIWRIIFEATEKTQTPFLRRSLSSSQIEDAIQNQDEFDRYVRELIISVTTAPDRNLDKSIVNNFLNDLVDCSGDISDGLLDAIIYFRSNLRPHTQNNTFYFTNTNPHTYADKSRDEFITLIHQGMDMVEVRVQDAGIFQLIHIKIILNYYTEIIRGYSNRDHISPLIKRVKKRITDLQKCISFVPREKLFFKTMNVISLRNVNLSMKKMIPLLICKFLFEDHKDKEDDTQYLNLIIDEAHNILSSASERESQQWKDYRLETFEEIIKEGRKFGVFLTLASQRPYDISQTIISQLHNYFLHRLVNNNDIVAIERTVSYLDKVSFDTLSILPTGTCIIAGILAPIPVVVDIGEIKAKYRPNNRTIEPIKNWEDA